jgi:orotidine-5'-phosphate decarboxylase
MFVDYAGAMSELFADRLIDAIADKGAPICVGIDPIISMFPANLPGHDQRPINPDDPEEAIDAIFAFTTAVLKTVAPHVPIVKFQSAYFEQYFWEGVEAYYSLIQEAEDLGLLVIGDVKRGDIGSTASAYAAAHLANPSFEDTQELLTPDAITVNPFLGLDTLEPFLQTARDFDKGLFVLLRTSNPGSALLQDAKLADGRTVAEMLADSLAPLAADPALMGSHGFSSLGVVVGATQVHTMQSLRARLPHCIFLLPGYGTQGATADMTRSGFIDGKGALISASRSILYAYRDKKYADQFGTDWKRCIEQAVLDMKKELAGLHR